MNFFYLKPRSTPVPEAWWQAHYPLTQISVYRNTKSSWAQSIRASSTWSSLLAATLGHVTDLMDPIITDPHVDMQNHL